MMRRLLPLAAIASVGALVAVVLPVATPAPGAPKVSEQGVPLSAQGVAPGWRADANVGADLVGVKWDGDPNAQFTVSTRDSSGHWSVPTPLDAVDTGPDPGTKEAAHVARKHATEPLWVHGDSDVRVTLASGSAANVELRTVHSPAQQVPASSASAAIAWPSVILRAQWGADESLRSRNCSPAPQYSDAVKFAVIHHTVDSNNYSPAQSYQIVRGIYAYSVLTLGYCDMMYNFLVDKYGQIFEGRYGGADKPVLGAHAIGFNWESVGVAAIGDYSTTTPSAALIDAIERLLAWKFAASGIDPLQPVTYTTNGNDKFPAGTTMVIPNIVGHRDTWFTACPGQALYDMLPAIRASVTQRIEFQPLDTFPGWRAQPGYPSLMAVSAFGALYPAGAENPLLPSAYFPGWQIVRAVKLLPGGGGGYVLDGYGGLHPFGSAPVVYGSYWPGWDIARDFTLLPSGRGGYVLDAWGGLHPFGVAPPIARTTFWPGWDIARRVAILPSGTGGYVLDGWGGVHPFGSAPAVGSGPYWPGWDIARDIAVQPSTQRVYVLDGFGGVWPLNGAPRLPSPYFGSDQIRGFALTATGGYEMNRVGTIMNFGGAPPVPQPMPIISPPYARQLAIAP
ncbi:MAG TPA: peptidoglycan recognition protein [Acidimicrobiia bacterium]|nr:peptidoglycan recognition protein [Acidimicrobiia bacterium]